MMTYITTRFNREAVNEKSDALIQGNITRSKIQRAAMVIGLEELRRQKIEDSETFNDFVLDNQEIEL